MTNLRIASRAAASWFVAAALLSACQPPSGVPAAGAGGAEPQLYPLDSPLILDVEEWLVDKSRTLRLSGITTREYGAPHFYVDATASVQPAWMTVWIHGIRHQDSDLDVIAGGATFAVPIDAALTGGDRPPLEGAPFRLDVRYQKQVDTYRVRITGDEVTVTPIQSAGLSSVRTPQWKRTPDDLLWYYAIRFDSTSGYLGEVSQATVQPLDDYLVSAGAQPWLLPAGDYKNLALAVDDRGVALRADRGNPDRPLHVAHTFRYPGDRAALSQQLSTLRFPAPEPWIFYLNPW